MPLSRPDMPSVADRSSATSTTSPGRRILSRIASPFNSKSRSVADFYIQPDDPHKQYSPGDIVSGSVRLRALRPTRVTHIVVALHGFVQVFKNPGSPGEGFRANANYLGTGRGKKSGEYFGNGFASLFEDEVVLCGDGRLAEGAYQFNFELEFPDRDLPSSIDFERGTISYMITATVTRPTTISPLITCDRKVYFVERIDIAPLCPPKTRTITLEPISRRTRAKHQAKRLVDSAERRSRKTDSASQSDAQHDTQSVAPSTQADSDPPMSPSPSEESFESVVTGWHRASQPDTSSGSPRTSSNMKANQSKTSLTTRTITTELESCVGGCLRGDHIPVKVNVNHTKHIKSMNGVIVTLYRHARVDMHPAIPLGATEKGKKPKYEDYYPKSVTGLGGLSLSGAGSSHIFRKDLSQSIQPLIVHPGTLNAEVTVKVRVPEDAFPTISTVPGAMISFRYYVEVVVDVQGKVDTRERALSNLGGLATTTMSGNDEYDGGRNGLAPFGSNIIDTSPIRRDKGVVACSFEVVIGTRDSDRRKGKRKMEFQQPAEDTAHGASQELDRQTTQAEQGRNPTAVIPTEEPWQYSQQDWAQGYPEGYDHLDYHDEAYDEQTEVPMPQLEDESQLPEKERMRRAEERLLPSQPPGVEQEVGESSQGATAPFIPEEVGGAAALSTPAYDGPPASAKAPPANEVHLHHNDLSAPAPGYFPASPGPSTTAAPPASDDKQELQRQRLQMEASAPPGDEDAAGPSDSQTAQDLAGLDGVADQATAPLADDVHDSHAEASSSADLPRYER